MAASWKYFGLRTLNAVLVLAVVIFIISALYSGLAEQQLKSQIQEQIKAEIKQLQQTRPDLNATSYRENRTEELRKKYNLNKPIWQRIINRTKNTMTLNFGKAHQMTDYEGSREVTDIIMSRLPRTILLFTTAAFFYVILGLVVGLKAAQVAGSKLDRFLSIFGITMSSTPMWWLGMIAILIFAFRLGWFPAAAYPLKSLSATHPWASSLPENVDYTLGVLYRMVLPLCVIVLNLFGGRAWATRNLVTDVLQDDYIMAARAKGIPERKVIYGHTLKTAAPPIVTSAILTFFASIGGAMITEIIFNWPGLGRLTYVALMSNEVPVVLGVVFISTFLYVAGYLIADLIYGYLDPRVEVGAEKNV